MSILDSPCHSSRLNLKSFGHLRTSWQSICALKLIQIHPLLWFPSFISTLWPYFIQDILWDIPHQEVINIFELFFFFQLFLFFHLLHKLNLFFHLGQSCKPLSLLLKLLQPLPLSLLSLLPFPFLSFGLFSLKPFYPFLLSNCLFVLSLPSILFFPLLPLDPHRFQSHQSLMFLLFLLDRVLFIVPRLSDFVPHSSVLAFKTHIQPAADYLTRDKGHHCRENKGKIDPDKAVHWGHALLIETAQASRTLGIKGAVVFIFKALDLLHNWTRVEVLTLVVRTAAAKALWVELTKLAVQIFLIRGTLHRVCKKDNA